MRVKNETEVTSRGSRKNRVTISEKKSRIKPTDKLIIYLRLKIESESEFRLLAVAEIK